MERVFDGDPSQALVIMNSVYSGSSRGQQLGVVGELGKLEKQEQLPLASPLALSFQVSLFSLQEVGWTAYSSTLLGRFFKR
jgi:hypothetical protein